MGNIKELFYYGEELSWNEGSSEQWDSYQRVKQRGIGLCVRVKIRKQKVFKIDSWIGLWAKHMNGRSQRGGEGGTCPLWLQNFFAYFVYSS